MTGSRISSIAAALELFGVGGEIPNVHDFKSTFVGDTPVVVNPTEDGVAAW